KTGREQGQRTPERRRPECWKRVGRDRSRILEVGTSWLLEAHTFNTFSAQVTGRKRKQMNTTTSLDSSTLRRNSWLFWCTLVIPAGIIGIGINFILNPAGASTAFGIPIRDPAAFPFMWVKGIRDIFSGLVVLSFLWSGDRRTTAILFA